MADPRLADLKDLNGEFPFAVPESVDEWNERRAALTRQLLVANGLWPMPADRPPVRATVHGRVHREGYTVDRVFLETSPGLFVTGSYYKPAEPPADKMPAIMCPHMHTPADPGSGGGRFHDCVQEIDSYLLIGNLVVTVGDGRAGGAVVFEHAKGATTPATSGVIYSASKWVAGAAILGAVGSGALRLDDPAHKHLQWWSSDPGDPRSRTLAPRPKRLTVRPGRRQRALLVPRQPRSQACQLRRRRH